MDRIEIFREIIGYIDHKTIDPIDIMDIADQHEFDLDFWQYMQVYYELNILDQ